DAVARERAVKELSNDATKLLEISGNLREAAQEGLRRDKALRQLARDNRVRLERTSTALQGLASDALESAEGIDAMSAAVDEIGAFLVLVQKIARQSKLLAPVSRATVSPSSPAKSGGWRAAPRTRHSERLRWCRRCWTASPFRARRRHAL